MSSLAADRWGAAGRARPARVKVWDGVVRLFHWALVAAVAVALVSGLILPRTWLGWHLVSGVAAVTLVMARVVWGLLGTGYARFSSFVAGPRRILDHLGELRHGAARRHLGHNPAGGAMILALLVLVAALALTGVAVQGGALKFGPLAFVTSFAAGRTLGQAHKLLAYGLLGLIPVHVAGAIHESRRTKENLVRAMVDGRKQARPGDAVMPARRSHPWLALAIATAIFGLAAGATVTLSNRPGLGVPTEPLDPIYLRECGSCHTAYHPSLLPASTWAVMLDGLAHHFGEDAALDPAAAQSIRAYLAANGAENYDTKAAHLFRAADPADPLRITATPFWRRVHRSLPEQVFSANAVGSRSECGACHRDAAAGLFNPLSIAIPEEAWP